MEYCNEYGEFFKVYRNDVSGTAKNYLSGLLMKAPRKNMERMEEYVDGANYDSYQHFLSVSPWDHLGLNKQVRSDVNSILGGEESVFCIDESGFTKKGNDSVGVSHQYNGRLGKLDNCQVGVFASLCNDSMSSIIDNRLYLPRKEWINDNARCEKAKVPQEYRVFKTKQELALDMVDVAIEEGLTFGWVAADGFYGRDSKFLNALDDQELLFVVDVPCDQTVYLKDPKPYLPRRRNKKGPKFKNLRSRTEGTRVDEFFKQIQKSQWNKVEIRDTTKGKLFSYAYRKRLYVWDGLEKHARERWLVITQDPITNEVKYFLSNADTSVSLTTLVRKHAQRFWIERTFQDGKTSVGMADYQVRRWKGWQHHMSMVMLALLFLLKERIGNKKNIELLSCQDIIELLNFYLPRKDVTEEAVFNSMMERHRKREYSIKSAYKKQKQALTSVPK